MSMLFAREPQQAGTFAVFEQQQRTIGCLANFADALAERIARLLAAFGTVNPDPDQPGIAHPRVSWGALRVITR